MLTLAIETSCDETAVALLQSSPGSVSQILQEEISSQTEIHECYGGVVPELASREHLKNVPVLVNKLLTEQGVALANIDLIAVTRGPGLKGCLLIGLDFAKGLAVAAAKPLLGVNHIEGHLLVPMLDNPSLQFPYLALIVSGGHTEIIEVKGVGRYSLITRTIDDAAGEAFDKSANLLGLAYPGGAKLAALADSVGEPVPSELHLPKVMREAEGFSFSGLKTAIALKVKRLQGRFDAEPQLRGLLAKSIQERIVETLVHKVEQAIRQTGIRNVAVSGGVSANRALRAALAAMPHCTVHAPSMLHCMDNAAMIAYTGQLRFELGEQDALDITAISRWPVETMDLACRK